MQQEALTKMCKTCRETKPLSLFYASRSNRDGRESSCKQCKNQHRREYDHRLKESNRELYFQRKWRKYLYDTFHITPSQYMAMYDQQNGVCAICGKPETGANQYGVKRLSIDHDHQTGKIRSLLCDRCNGRLVYVENSSFVVRDLEYLAFHNNTTALDVLEQISKIELK
jgi:Autographiviridae endonuclease VII